MLKSHSQYVELLLYLCICQARRLLLIQSAAAELHDHAISEKRRSAGMSQCRMVILNYLIVRSLW